MPKKKNPRPINPRRIDERRYHKRVKKFVLDPLFAGLIVDFNRAEELRGQILASINRRFDEFDLGDIPEREAAAHIDQLRKWHRKETLQTFQAALGVSVSGSLFDTALRPNLAMRVRENVGLITSIPQNLQNDLLNAVDETLVKKGFDQQALRTVLNERFRVGDSRARLITRDQTNKTVGDLTKLRQQQLGIKEYIWRTSADERVRDDHADNGGQVFKWDEPPSTGHPGEAIQCRCVAIAKIPDNF